ncbi:MAG: glucose dehydrogenase, partial [Betaproteobacteria bacterium]
AGGNAIRGRDLFVSHPSAQCIRCHTVAGQGGTAGPDLSALSSPERNADRRHLLESIVLPNAKIAKGFGTVTLVLDSGKLVAGTIKDEDDTSLTLVTPTNETVRIARETIDEQSATVSAMPVMSKALTLRDIRDLVEYLSTLKTGSNPQGS